ncbi:hypothetical protein CC78DRAFT_598853 [Lojkania enalia]|uniref:Nucleoside phosphorylase domain-containing protein n=1 Tax=Lojkania enalia TaxID=147567 RepID=A0A9P4KAD7_9PLEO|nr:hypothetical protein CC78DRAFT_598853 [Didymosphaeria enalia]
MDPSIEDYTIGWICALQEEYEAAYRILDDELDGPETNAVNDNTYLFSRIGGHNVVVGCLPINQYGIISATSVAKDIVRSFPNLRFALMLGIGEGAPIQRRDIRLEDVLVDKWSFPTTGQLDAPPLVLLGVIPEMQRRHNDRRKPDRVAKRLKLIDDMPEYRQPAEDWLYRSDFENKGGMNCEKCEADGLEEDPMRETNREVTVQYSTITSANSVVKDATDGPMNNFSYLVARGVCDNSDSHKNDE